MNPHLPYDAPGEEKYVFGAGNQLNNVRRGFGAKTAKQRNHIKKAYLAEVRYVDTRIGLLLDYLREAGLYDDMLIVLVSDHGEEFWEHDGFEHGHTMYDELLNVPLIIKLPGSSAVGIRKEVVDTQSLMPTILDVCAIPYDLNDIQATPLQPLWDESGGVEPRRVISASPLYFEKRESLTTEKWKYIFSYVSRRQEIYDLERDPLEQRNLFYERPEIVESMREAMIEMYNEVRQFRIPGDSGADNKVEFDEAVKENLRAIGYLDQ